jgi:MFS family permease
LMGSAAGCASLPFVTRDWHFLFPATAFGFGQALLYPAIVSLGAGAFPRRYRGMGTTVVLGFIELGTATSPPALGWIIDRYGFHAMFYSAATVGVCVAVCYTLTAARVPDHDSDAEDEVVSEEVTTLPAPVVAPDAASVE